MGSIEPKSHYSTPITFKNTVDKFNVPVVSQAPLAFKTGTHELVSKSSYYCLAADKYGGSFLGQTFSQGIASTVTKITTFEHYENPCNLMVNCSKILNIFISG